MVVRMSAAGASGSGPEHDVEFARWTCAFVNNMPDAAFDVTERQYLDLLATASGADVIEVRRYAMRGVPRGEQVAKKIKDEYSSMDSIGSESPDLLIVTGSNPVEVRIEDEPYWSEMVGLLLWARDNVQSMLLSCLAAHAALTIFDGVERSALDTKLTGVFGQEVDHQHELTSGLGDRIVLPHSRKNGASVEALRAAGYRVLASSIDVGWSLATRTLGSATVVLVQGHPEYDPSSLLREYRRDAGRYVRHERNELPVLPVWCVAQVDWDGLEALHLEIIAGRSHISVLEDYPFDVVGERAPWPWRPAAERLYSNWLASVSPRRRQIQPGD